MSRLDPLQPLFERTGDRFGDGFAGRGGDGAGQALGFWAFEAEWHISYIEIDSKCILAYYWSFKYCVHRL